MSAATRARRCSARSPALHAETRDGDTLLRGAVADQAALHGVLAKVEALGLELLEVRACPASRKPIA